MFELRFCATDLNAYSHVRCEAVAKGFGTPTQHRNCHQRELTLACCSLISVHANFSSDLSNGNVLFDIASLDNFDTKTKYEYLGRPKKVALTSFWRPGELVKPMEVPKSLLRETVYLSDFSMAIKAGTEVNRKVLFPFVFCAPERFHGVNPSFASDMWSFMRIFSYLYLGCVPWHSTNSNVLMAKMVEALGPLPEQWKSRYSQCLQFPRQQIVV